MQSSTVSCWGSLLGPNILLSTLHPVLMHPKFTSFPGVCKLVKKWNRSNATLEQNFKQEVKNYISGYTWNIILK
jgi:hypothetical protein